MQTDLQVTIAGMGLIGASLYKAAVNAGYSTGGIDKNDAVDLSGTDILLLALPAAVIPAWFEKHAEKLPRGSIIVDTCGIKKKICGRIKSLLPEGCFFVGGHPMAGKEVSGQAYADAKLFQGASIILTPDRETPEEILTLLKKFFSSLGFAKVLLTSAEHHDRMIAFTSQLGHIIAASYTQEPLTAEASGYTAGSYANMTRIASMEPEVWTTLFLENKEFLLPVLDRFLERMSSFRNFLAKEQPEKIRRFIADGARSKAGDGVHHGTETGNSAERSSLGEYLKLRVSGASHASEIGMELEHFPRGIRIDTDALNTFMARRAPGRDDLSTRRREADLPCFQSGLCDGMTTGETIKAVIKNTDSRPNDYARTTRIPRPGHADYTQWVQTGRIPAGGGNHSGRMTAPLCIAGGICLQWFQKRGITVSSRLVSAGGNPLSPEEAIRSAKADGDSVGGIIEVTVSGLPAGLGGPLFQGVEAHLASAVFSIPGVKGFEIGDGFALAARRGSQSNDAFELEDGKIITKTNRQGGLLGGITTGMPVVFRLAMKPTPSIYKEQESVDLETFQNATCLIEGRHDPCIARRAMPVAEALTAFVFADMLLADEAAHPRICLVLTEPTLEENLAVLRRNFPFADMCELRADCLNKEQFPAIGDFPARAGIPVILTFRRVQDGGKWRGTEDERMKLMENSLSSASVPFAYIDLEDDFRIPGLEDRARRRGTRIIRSLHDFSGPVENIVERASAMKGSSDDIPKIACMIHHCYELDRLFRETAQFTGFPHIICAMGVTGQASRILSGRTHSMLTFTSPAHARENLNELGHVTPEVLVRRYGFRNLTDRTALYGVTGWPLEHTLSPELNNEAFFAEAMDAVMIPLPAENAEEALHCAETLGIRGMAVTIPHKKAMLPLMADVSPEAAAAGAVNTVIHTVSGWYGANTDITGFRKALLKFLNADTLSGRKVAILGAGGAATAVAYVVSQLGGDACIFNKTFSKAEELAARYHFRAAVLGPESIGLMREYSGIIIQCTSAGLSSHGKENGDDPVPFYTFQGHETLFDLIYSPPETPVMTRARKAGCRVENGFNMLVEQAKEQRRLYASLNA